MTNLNLELSCELDVKMKARIRSAGYKDAGSYLRDLIIADTVGLEKTAPAHLSPKTTSELERMLIDGLASGEPIELTAMDWDKKRQQLAARHTK